MTAKVGTTRSSRLRVLAVTLGHWQRPSRSNVDLSALGIGNVLILVEPIALMSSASPMSPSQIPDAVRSAVPVVVPSAEERPATQCRTEPPGSQKPQAIEFWGPTTVWDVPFDSVTLGQAVDHIGRLVERGTPSYVITANLNYVMLHHRESDMAAITEAAALVLADGQPIVWRSKLDAEPLPQRVAGSEMIFHLAERAAKQGWGIYFLGGDEGAAAACADKLACKFPGLRIAGVESPPFRPLTAEEQAEQDARILRSDAQILLVAFGQPKGERWIAQHHQRLGVPVSIQLGASFDFIAGTARRAPLIWQRLGLEWAYRVGSDPRRLVPRYTANAIFLCQALIDDWKRKVDSWGMGL